MNACFRNQWTSEGNTSVLVPVRELTAWIESNILLQLASAPFDKQDDAGRDLDLGSLSAHRYGFNPRAPAGRDAAQFWHIAALF